MSPEIWRHVTLGERTDCQTDKYKIEKVLK